MENERQRIKSITLDVSREIFQDMDNLFSVELKNGDEITIKGYNRRSRAVVTYKVVRNDARKAGILREEYENENIQ